MGEVYNLSLIWRYCLRNAYNISLVIKITCMATRSLGP